MAISDLSIRLKELLDDYFNHRILLDEYRAQRKIILDEIDVKYNQHAEHTDGETGEKEHEEESNIVSEILEVKDKSEDMHT